MNRLLRLIVVVLAFVLVTLLALAAWREWRMRSEPVPEIVQVDSTSTGMRAMTLYFAAASGDSLVRESREMLEADGVRARAAALVAELERGPQSGGAPTLPAGTAVLHAYLDERGLLTLDLSRAFLQNFRGGSGAEYLAIGSLVRTLGDDLPEVKRVLIVCGGTPIATLGGHLPLDRPLDVSQWS